MPTYLLLDGHSLAFRAWFALQESGLATASGQQTQAIFGFVSMVTKLLDDTRPAGMAVAFDLRGPTFRDAIAPDYKAGRPPTPDPLLQQIELIGQFVDALGVPRMTLEGYEADDVIGTLATKLAAAGNDVVIVTGDRDTYQLVEDPHIKVLYNRRGVSDYVLYDEAGILERTGVRPVDYPLYAALRGDPSDNLPGVPGVGEKTAARLVNDFGDVDGIFANLAKLTPKLRESVAGAEEQVRRNLLMTPIVRDLPIEPDTEAFGFHHVDREGLEQLLGFLEMRKPFERLGAVLDTLGGSEEGPVVSAAVARRPVRSLDELDDALKWVETLTEETATEGRVALEATWAGTPGRSAIEGLAILRSGGEEVGFIPGPLLGEVRLLEALATVLDARPGADPQRVVANRAKELMRALLPAGLDLRGLVADVAVLAYLVDPSLGQEGLEEIARRRGIEVSEVSAPASGQLDFDLEAGPPDDLPAQTARRAEVVDAIGERLLAELDEVGGRELWETIERPLVRVLAKMEVAGIAVNTALLGEINAELTEEVARLEGEIHTLAGEPFNLNSPPQLRVVLYEKLGLRPQRRTKTGFSTDAQTLEKLRDEHPIIEKLLEYREVEKLRSTYGTGLIAEVAPDGRIHASFNQTVARTGRLSSDAPNLHNIPVRSEGGRRFREAFIAPEGHELLVADYNQIELRVIAHLSGDPGLVTAFEEERDIHNATAAAIYGVEPAGVTSAMRAKAKMVSYGLAYGMEAYGLAQRLAIPVDEASQILNQYFVAFPSVRAYMEATVTEARRRGYTETECGRRRYLPELTSDNFRVRQAAERQAMNAGIQGLAADIFKLALVRLDAAIEAAGLRSRIVLQVHDEILLEVPTSEREEAHRLTVASMHDAYPLRVPLDVHIEWGKTWSDAK
jgi:DNA polymerase-1